MTRDRSSDARLWKTLRLETACDPRTYPASSSPSQARLPLNPTQSSSRTGAISGDAGARVVDDSGEACLQPLCRG